MNTWVLLIWIAFAVIAYTFVLIGLARVPSGGDNRKVRTRTWAASVAASLLAVSTGFGPAPLLIVLATWLIVTVARRHTGQPTPSDPPATLSDASTEQLCERWEQSTETLDRAYLPSTIQAVVELREEILAELTRRDPSGVEDWLNDQPADHDPRLYLHDLAP